MTGAFRPLPLTLLALFALPLAAASGAGATLPAGIDVLTTDQVLSDRTREGSDGTLYLLDAEGVLRRFVTSTADSVVTNPGSGRFHPIEPDPLAAALLAIDSRFLSEVSFSVYLLPYPVETPLRSWAGLRTIYLSPGVYPMSETQLHQLVAHEVGHIVHRRLLPDDDRAGWEEYRRIRGIEDTTIYHAHAAHRNRPNEVFAEDFRVLFGGERARADGAIENADLMRPDQAPGLASFFLSLIDAAGGTPEPLASIPRVFPNPIAAGAVVRLALPDAGESASIVAHDVAGRVVREFGEIARAADGRFEIAWDGKDRLGRTLPRGVYFLRSRGGSVSARIQVIG